MLDQLKMIAVEKSGIIKKGIPLILGNIEGLELQEIVKIAYQKHLKSYILLITMQHLTKERYI